VSRRDKNKVRIEPAGKDNRGRERWNIIKTPGAASLTVSTSASSVKILDQITVNRAPALKRLAKE
jgi:hypothetical protein